MSQSSSDPRERDWFSDGRDAARRLKEELGWDANPDRMIDPDAKDSKIEENQTRQAAMESGRSAARALLDQMSADKSTDADVISSTKKVDETVPIITGDQEKPPDHFDLPSAKSHCLTICMVPPPTATAAWAQLTSARRSCRDPGFYRWPPHVNLLYPFVEPIFDIDGDLDKASRNEKKEDIRTAFMTAVCSHLSKAAKQCMSFDVTLDSFGTFGGKSRGVMWANPKSKHYTATDINNNVKDPLVHLQNELEKQFPMCTEQKKQGSFTPHMTISHYANITDALVAKEEVLSIWEPVSFRVSEIYLLNRKGDGGQFMIAATIPLGHGSVIKVHNPPLRFPDMPLVEEEWVLDERMKMKDRRKKSFKRSRRKRDDQL
jgi:2'-5' RNA ligase